MYPNDVQCYLPPALDLWTAHGGLVIADDVGPGGNQTGYSLTEPNAFGEFYVEWDFTIPQSQPYPRTGPFSVVVLMKANGRDWGWIDVGNGAINRYAYFDLQNGVVGTVSSPENEITATIEAVGGGWYRCTMNGFTQPYVPALTPPYAADAAGVTIGPADADDSFGYNGNGTGVIAYAPYIELPGYAAY